MCGIVGIAKLGAPHHIDEGVLSEMNNAQYHRGPDDSGLYTDLAIGLGHRRLSIIDLVSGRQPLTNEDSTVYIVFNGEIYNYHDLSRTLIDKGHVFQTSSDTEVIVHAWEEWGEQCVKHLRGMFAFAIWDKKQQTLFIARDRVGIKPLYYATLDNDEFIFGSELKSLQVHPKFKKILNLNAVEDYFSYGYVPDPKTIYKDVYKLPPAHTLTINLQSGNVQLKSYWDILFDSDKSFSHSENYIQEQLIDQLRESLNLHMISDVPVASFLSGGVDSSAVVAMMAQESKGIINTCSISFNEAAADESKYAAEVASRYNTRHHSDTVTVDHCMDIDWILSMYDEPFADSSAIPTYHVCAMAKKYAKVVLSGDGGDEIFAGYKLFEQLKLRNRVRLFLPGLFGRSVLGVFEKVLSYFGESPRVLRARSGLRALKMDYIDYITMSLMCTSPKIMSQIFSSNFKKNLKGYDAGEVIRAHANNGPSNPLSLYQYIVMKTYLPGDILTKVDRASMAHSLEVRVPFLDHKFIEWGVNVPPSLRIRKKQGKYILKKSLKKYLSDDILYRKKMGFSIPLDIWLKGDLRPKLEDILSDGVLSKSGLFDMDAIRKIAHKHWLGKENSNVFFW